MDWTIIKRPNGKQLAWSGISVLFAFVCVVSN